MRIISLSMKAATVMFLLSVLLKTTRSLFHFTRVMGDSWTVAVHYVSILMPLTSVIKFLSLSMDTDFTRQTVNNFKCDTTFACYEYRIYYYNRMQWLSLRNDILLFNAPLTKNAGVFPA